MTTLESPKIDILRIEKNKMGVYTVCFWDENYQGENITTVQISESLLIDFIIENDLNVETFIDYNQRNLECDGLDERTINVFDYLEENTDFAVKEYITANV